MLQKIVEFIGSLKTRAVDNKNTTIGGVTIGVLLAAFIGQIETATGCHFQTAFADVSWMQVLGGTFSAVFGAVMTDGKKTV